MRVECWPDELDGGYVAETPDYPGLMSQGSSPEAAAASLFDAVQEAREAGALE